MKKNLPFHDVLYRLVFLYFSTTRQVAFALHNKKITVVKDFKAAQPIIATTWTNVMEKFS